MPKRPPRHRTGGNRDPREPPMDSSSLEKLPDISEMLTGYLVPPEPVQEIRASREEQLKAQRALGDHLLAQQRALMRQAADWQKQLFAERSADRRAEIQLQIDNLWAAWNELERQIRAHRQAMRAQREPNPHA
jgi:hypothetical protein